MVVILEREPQFAGSSVVDDKVMLNVCFRQLSKLPFASWLQYQVKNANRSKGGAVSMHCLARTKDIIIEKVSRSIGCPSSVYNIDADRERKTSSEVSLLQKQGIMGTSKYPPYPLLI